MEIEQHDTRLRGEFLAISEGREVGKLTYSWVGIDQISIKHTGTDPEFRQQGIGLALVSAAVDFARTKKIKILPLCSFTKQEFRKHPEWKDVLFS
jgi:predicted GNAT family acetyltransferase